MFGNSNLNEIIILKEKLDLLEMRLNSVENWKTNLENYRLKDLTIYLIDNVKNFYDYYKNLIYNCI